ncbi:DUF2244 domain-containing protein [Hyphomonas pacifica]|uniref:Uncharacterized protein n=1 Tax=Hyphomonas pacifica TaxID=1280941 RepID=A0A062TZ15_9PROT|nr:DUF2244 domain-containing protein [Hyphomonas pacifica]KCZ50718.1 hypothetical protein HY2_02375 [Hyphomonas pacifica]RAN30998.1 hypothetical protein HY3_05210 [Hyphomonas pacifica]RAN34936.1 hypothetical protein HY11_02775 [Hyphomonas pacifica]
MQEIIYMDAVLRPNRSLSQRGFTIVMAIVGGVSFLTGMAFISMGAIPVIGFFGLDALAFYLAFRLSFKRQQEETHIRISAREMCLTHTKADGSRKEAKLPTAFARVELDEPLTPNSWLRIEYGKTAYIIGRFLTLPERKSLAKALRAALHEARLERNPAH